MKVYMLKRYHDRMNDARDKLGSKCCKCGSLENLQIDHIDPELKSWTIGQMWSLSQNKFDEELKKCQLLCFRCHNLKTLEQNGKQDAKSLKFHGTLSTYRYCKCNLCRKAKSDWMKIYRNR